MRLSYVPFANGDCEVTLKSTVCCSSTYFKTVVSVCDRLTFNLSIYGDIGTSENTPRDSVPLAALPDQQGTCTKNKKEDILSEALFLCII